MAKKGLCIFVLLGQFLLVNMAMAACVFYDNVSTWQAALASSSSLRLDNANLDPIVGFSIADGHDFGASLTLPMGTLEAVNSGYEITFDDASSYPPGDGIGIGLPRGDAETDDDWRMTSFSQTYYGFGVDIWDNNEPGIDDGLETFSVLSGGLWYSIDNSSSPFWPDTLGQTFIGVISDQPLDTILLDDGAGPDADNIVLFTIYTGVPEPCTLGLLILGGAVMVRRRRQK